MLPSPYYFYGSHDSTDTDVMMEYAPIPARHEAQNIVKMLKTSLKLDWNINLVCIRGGHITDTVPSKGSPDNLNNSLFDTYQLHPQQFPLPISGRIPRNLTLNVYKCFRTVLSLCTRTPYRRQIKPTLKWLHPFGHKLDSLALIDFRTLDVFGNKYTKDIDIWKIIAFTVAQSLSLIAGVEIYTKSDLVQYHPELRPFIYREAIGQVEKGLINALVAEYLVAVQGLGIENPEQGVLIRGTEGVYMENEVGF